MVGVVLSKPFEGVQATEANGGVEMSKLLNSLTVQLGDTTLSRIVNVIPGNCLRMCLRHPCDVFGMGLGAFAQPLTANREQQGDSSTGSRSDAETHFDRLDP